MAMRTQRVGPPTDRERFEQIFARYDRRLRKFAAGIVADRHRVDDVLQEAYVRAYCKLPRRFASPTQESVWLFRVVYRCCVDELRRDQRRPTHFLEDSVEAPVDRRAGLDRALRRLKPRDRAVILLVGAAGFEHEEAARILGLPRGTVSWRLGVARDRFRQALVDEGVLDA